MTKRAKRIKKLFQNPKTVRFETLHKVLLEQGFEMRQPKSGSSHYVYCRGEVQMTVPFKKPFVKEVYVKRVLEIIGEDQL